MTGREQPSRPRFRPAGPGPARVAGPPRRAGTGREGAGGRFHWRRARDQTITVAWLVLVWSLLWGEFSWGNLAGGVLVAVVVLVVFPLPRVTFEGRVRPVALACLVARFVVQLVAASVHVAWVAVRPRYRLRNAVVGVRLRNPTDLNLTLTAEVLSLVPGTLVVETERETGSLFVHVLDVRGAADLAAAREQTLTLEHRLIRAFGSRAELRRLSSTPHTRSEEDRG